MKDMFGYDLLYGDAVLFSGKESRWGTGTIVRVCGDSVEVEWTNGTCSQPFIGKYTHSYQLLKLYTPECTWYLLTE